MDPGTFLLEDYRQKIGYLSAHLGRMWTRFNFFVTLEVALLGGRVLLVGDQPAPMVGLAGMILSLVWYLMGAQDRFLADFYRWQVKEAAGRVGAALDRLREAPTEKPEQKELRDALIPIAQKAAKEYVGVVDDDPIKGYRNWRDGKIEGRGFRLLESVSSWRSQFFSTTHLAAWIPLLAFVLWLLFLLYQS